MNVSAPLRRWTSGLALVAAAACASEAVEEAEPGIASVVVTQWNDSTELFLEYPHPVAGVPTGNWAIHMTDRGAYEPIRSGRVTVRFAPDPASPGATEQSFAIDAPLRDGIFVVDPIVSSPGVYAVEIDLVSPQATSSHALEGVRVFATLDEAPLEEPAAEEPGITFLKEQQWVMPFRVAAVEERDVLRTVTAPAEIVAPDGALVEVGAPVDGIAPADANRLAPSVGARVTQGDVLVVLAPATAAGGFADLRGEVERLEVELARSERLFAAGATPQRRVEDARRELAIARAEMDAMGGALEGDLLLRLRAPMSGVIARRDFVPGGRVSAGSHLFTIVDPGAAWLRVQIPAAQATVLAPTPAHFTLEGSDAVHETGRLLSVGRVIDERTRTVPVVYEADGDAQRFAFGQIATAMVPVGSAERGVAIPESAILDEGGTATAYVQTEGESFERRALILGPRDGAYALVLAGLALGDMVVVTGAYQVRLASLSANEFAGAHAH